MVLLPGASAIPCHANMHIDTQTRERRKAMKQEPDLAAETILTANELKAQAEELEANLHKYDLTEEESKEKVFLPTLLMSRDEPHVFSLVCWLIAQETLISEGMGKWIKSDFRKFLSACERHGRKAQAAICTDVALATGKTEQEVMNTRQPHYLTIRKFLLHPRFLRISDRCVSTLKCFGDATKSLGTGKRSSTKLSAENERFR